MYFKLKHIIFLFAIILVASCAKENEQQQVSAKTMSKSDVYNFITGELTRTNKAFDWNTASDDLIFAAGQHSDAIFSIGYQPNGFTDMKDKIHQINLQEKSWTETREMIEKMILQYEKTDKTPEGFSVLAPADKKFPHIYAVIKNKELISKLRTMPEVRFVEPLGYSLEPEVTNRSTSGCSGTPDPNINTADYTVLSPLSKRPWNFATHNIPTAWNTAKGQGVTICIIDTGAGNSQDNLGSQFASGNSTGRTITKMSTLYSGSLWWQTLDTPHDQCGHGTSMAGLAAAPWSNDGNAVGAAYKANLLTIRAVEDVLINTSNERNGVRDALYVAGNNSSVKIISMSIGSPISSSTVSDGIYYAYNRGKMIFAAAGTSFSWTTWYGVIFPAWMPECIAVTGVKEGSTNAKCSVCHEGAEVDFTVVMERTANADRNSIGLALTGNDPKYIGGSSCATATTAGVAAMLWSKTPSATRTQVFNALRNTAQFYPNANGNLGWGRINASAAMSNI
jgi:serine protease